MEDLVELGQCFSINPSIMPVNQYSIIQRQTFSINFTIIFNPPHALSLSLSLQNNGFSQWLHCLRPFLTSDHHQCKWRWNQVRHNAQRRHAWVSMQQRAPWPVRPPSVERLPERLWGDRAVQGWIERRFWWGHSKESQSQNATSTSNKMVKCLQGKV